MFQDYLDIIDLFKNAWSIYSVPLILSPLLRIGKWTTYRSMASDTMDKVVEVGEFTEAKECQTDGFILEGGDGWYNTLFIRLIQDYGLDTSVRVL